ncbi:MAG TPA: MBL fold metallo-hydrolase [Actinomycetota bacterium]|jgi:glyoxylase-like metal-dependent hydrolase (beta-lactamase superfamily II)/rhodanese-related sulfurtransferase|nr:MBL fold metallo-hydrolase [Actinomycetota bacterium]
MKAELFHDAGLGNGSYLLRTEPGRALLVDPDRRVDRYLSKAEELGLEVTAVLDTHVHADFVTGSLELAARTGATLHVPDEAAVGFAHRGVKPGERIELGELEIEVLATPGHAPEHVSYVVHSGDGPPVLFSGGALIAGGAARSDLVSPELTDRLTRDEFRTLHEAFRSLPDESPLFPTHGGGSFCSAGAEKQHTSTLGEERSTNPLLSMSDEDEFVEWWPTTFPATPAYFTRMRAVNRAGPLLRAEIDGPQPLAPQEFADAARREGALVVDCRPPEDYLAAHVEDSLAVPFRDAFPTWLGWLAPENARLLFVADGLRIEEVVDACLLVGYERFDGVLDGGMKEWIDRGLEVRSLPTIGPQDAVPWLAMGAQPLDVREPDEFELEHIAHATPAPLGTLVEAAGELPTGRPLLTYCAAGMRSVSAASILERLGIGPVVNLRGGYGAWRSAHRD